MYTRAAYIRLLRIVKEEGYLFGRYTQMEERAERLLHLRHDIDYSIDWALELARINAAEGARATFCFQLRSPLYNLLAYPAIQCVKEISALGQDLAMHYTNDKVIPDEDGLLAQQILDDYDAIRRVFPGMVPAFGWHNPSLAPDLLERGLDLVVPGMVNMYSRHFVKAVKYVSDSNIRYTVPQLESLIRAGHPKMQLLVHPFQWLADGKDMLEILAKTWKQVIREREREFLTNHVYRQRFPRGIPDNFLDRFVDAFESKS